MKRWKAVGGYHRKDFFLCVIVSALLYISAWMLLAYFVNEIMRSEDVSRYCYYDMYFSEQLSAEQLQDLEEDMQQAFVQNVGAVCYVQFDEWGAPILAIPSGEESELGMAEEHLTSGQAVALVGYDEVYGALFPQLEWRTNADILIYGSQPLFVFGVMLKEDFFINWNSTDMIVLRTIEPLDFMERVKLKNIMQTYTREGALQYVDRMSWIKDGLWRNRYYIIFSMAIIIYTGLALFLLLKYMFQSQKRELAIYSLCGATMDSLRKYLIIQTFSIQVLAFVISAFASNVLLYGFRIIEIEEFHLAPGIIVILLMSVCMLYCFLYVSGFVKRACIVSLKEEQA